LPWLLSVPSEIARMASQSSVPSVRLDLSRFEREPQGSIDGLIARLGTLLGVPSIKAVLSGTTAFEFRRCLEPGAITILSFEGEVNARGTVRAVGSVALSALANAAFDPRRAVRGHTIVLVDEPQSICTPIGFAQMERLVTLGRSFGAGGVMFVHQGATQLPHELQLILATNIQLRALGRSARADASAAAEWLPRTGRVPRQKVQGEQRAGSRYLAEGQEDRFRVAEVGRLPARHFLISDRRADFAPRVVRSLDYDPPSWPQIDAVIAEAVRRGAAGVPRRELEARVNVIEAEAADWLAEVQAREEPTRRRGRRLETPDAVTRAAGGKKGILP